MCRFIPQPAVQPVVPLGLRAGGGAARDGSHPGSGVAGWDFENTFYVKNKFFLHERAAFLRQAMSKMLSPMLSPTFD